MTDGSGFPPPPPPSRWDEPPPPPYHPGSENLLKPVGITLVVYNALSIASALSNIAMWGLIEAAVAKEAERDKAVKEAADVLMPWMNAYNWTGLVLAIVALIGSIYLLRGRNYGLAMTGAIVTMLNPGSCCCVLGIAFGIWGLVVLLKPEAQAAFNRP